MSEPIERVSTPRGELVLRRDGEHYEIISNGVFLMDTRNGQSERVLVRAALDRHPGPRRVLLGGLGVGFSLIDALADGRVERVEVVEIEQTIRGWHDRYLRHITGAALADERTRVEIADISRLIRNHDDTYDAICLDVDNGPGWTVTDANAELYGDEGTAALARRLHPGGVLTVWSASRSSAYEQVLGRHFGKVEVIEIPVPRGEPDAVFVASQPVAQTQGRDSDSS